MTCKGNCMVKAAFARQPYSKTCLQAWLVKEIWRQNLQTTLWTNWTCYIHNLLDKGCFHTHLHKQQLDCALFLLGNLTYEGNLQPASQGSLDKSTTHFWSQNLWAAAWTGRSYAKRSYCFLLVIQLTFLFDLHSMTQRRPLKQPTCSLVCY